VKGGATLYASRGGHSSDSEGPVDSAHQAHEPSVELADDGGAAERVAPEIEVVAVRDDLAVFVEGELRAALEDRERGGPELHLHRPLEDDDVVRLRCVVDAGAELAAAIDQAPRHFDEGVAALDGLNRVPESDVRVVVGLDQAEVGLRLRIHVGEELAGGVEIEARRGGGGVVGGVRRSENPGGSFGLKVNGEIVARFTTTAGEVKEYDNPEEVKKLIEQKLSEGYKEIDIEDHHTLIIEYKVDGFGNEKDLNKRYDLQDRMDETLGWTGLGHCDGGSIGSGTMEVCCYVVEFELAKKIIEDDLQETDFADYTRIYDENNS